MTREEAKQLLPVIQAWAEGKNIQYLDSDFNWKDFDDDFSIGVSYRIKPESKYRPFKTQEECWEEMLKHQPFGWLIHKKSKVYVYPIMYTSITAVFADGTPFGIKEE